MTLVPAMADTAAHVTMLQRSPTYVVSRPDRDPIANLLGKILPDHLAYRATRWKNMRLGEWFYQQTRKRPDKIREKLLDGVRKGMPDVDVDTHFSPEYDPWDQRLCLIPNADLYEAVNSGAASVVTDHIERFDADGIVLTSGDRIDADVIVTATGLQLVTIGDMDSVTVDGREVDFSQTWTYKGLSYSGVPNLVSSFGYINASWTLRADITCGYVTRLLNHLTDSRNDIATPTLRSGDEDMAARPFIDDFSAGYMARMMPMLPKQGDRAPWLNPQLLSADRELIVEQPIDDGVVRFTRAAVRT